jgi:hypothetical protein
MLLSNKRQRLLSNRRQMLTQSLTLSPKSISSNTHLIERGSQTACNRKLGYHDSCTLYRALYPRVVISSPFSDYRTSMLPCRRSTITVPWCKARRSLHAFTNINPRSYVLLCHRFPLVGYNRIPSGPFHSC